MASSRVTRSQSRKQEEEPTCAVSKIAFVHLPYTSPRKRAQYTKLSNEAATLSRRIAFVQLPHIDAESRAQYNRLGHSESGSPTDTTSSKESSPSESLQPAPHSPTVSISSKQGSPPEPLAPVPHSPTVSTSPKEGRPPEPGAPVPGSPTVSTSSKGSNPPKPDEPAPDSPTSSSSSEEGSSSEPQPGGKQLGLEDPCPSLTGRLKAWAERWWQTVLSVVAILLVTTLLAQIIKTSRNNKSVSASGLQNFSAVVHSVLDPEYYGAVSTAAIHALDLTSNDSNELPKKLLDMITESGLVLDGWAGRLRRCDKPELRDLNLDPLLDAIWGIHHHAQDLNTQIHGDLYLTVVQESALKLHMELKYLHEYATTLQAAIVPQTRLESTIITLRTKSNPKTTRTLFTNSLQPFLSFAQSHSTISQRAVDQTKDILSTNRRIIDLYGEDFYPELNAAANQFREICRSLDRKFWPWQRPACKPDVQLSKELDLYKQEEKRGEVTLALHETIVAVRNTHQLFAEGLAEGARRLDEMAAQEFRVTIEDLARAVEEVLKDIEAAMRELEPFLERYEDALSRF